jgi:uncharacterized delta-60 repeat protein
MRRRALSVSVVLLVVAFASPAGAAGGDIDPTFGSGGVTVHDFAGGGGSDKAFAVAVQPDGSIVTAGDAYVSPKTVIVVARYTSAGHLDSSFGGGDGYTSINFGTRYAEPRAIVIRPSNGAIVVGGWAYNGSDEDFALARLTAAGNPDTSLNGTGKVTTSLSSGVDEAYALALGRHGSTFLSGEANVGSSGDFATVKYRANGRLATGFGGTGMVFSDFYHHKDAAGGVAVESNGDVVVGGQVQTDTGYAFAAARYLSDGSPDPSFDGDGQTAATFGYGDNAVVRMAIDAHGRIDLAGSVLIKSRFRFGVARFLSDGSLDPSFSGDGLANASLPGDSYVWAVGIDAAKILVAGSVFKGTAPYPAAMVRFTSRGSLDTSFSGDGKLIADLTPGHSSVIFGVAFQSDGEIVVAGDGNGNPGLPDQAVARYLGA